MKFVVRSQYRQARGKQMYTTPANARPAPGMLALGLLVPRDHPKNIKTEKNANPMATKAAIPRGTSFTARGPELAAHIAINRTITIAVVRVLGGVDIVSISRRNSRIATRAINP